jgi:hypothetical protein
MPAEITEVKYADPDPLSEFEAAKPWYERRDGLCGIGTANVSADPERRPLTPVLLILEIEFWDGRRNQMTPAMFDLEQAKALQHALLMAINEVSRRQQ